MQDVQLSNETCRNGKNVFVLFSPPPLSLSLKLMEASASVDDSMSLTGPHANGFVADKVFTLNK